MTHAIFISYRREDSGWSTQALYIALSGQFGADQVFMNVDDIQGGDDFVQRIKSAVSQCDALIAVIGPRWLLASNDGGRRLDNPNDYVRLEIRTALEREVRVIPVLVDGAPIPTVDNLPTDLTPLVQRNAVALNQASFQSDVKGLQETLQLQIAFNLASRERVTKPPKNSKSKYAHTAAWIGFAGAIVAALIVGVLSMMGNGKDAATSVSTGDVTVKGEGNQTVIGIGSKAND